MSNHENDFLERSKRGAKMRQFFICVFAADLVFAPVLAGDEFSIDWCTIDGRGELSSSGGEWALSATIGQWDATGPRQSKRGQWSLTGGFWGFTLEELAGLLFEDRFEEQEEGK